MTFICSNYFQNVIWFTRLVHKISIFKFPQSLFHKALVYIGTCQYRGGFTGFQAMAAAWTRGSFGWSVRVTQMDTYFFDQA